VNALAARLGLEASLGGMPCAGLTEPLDQRIESFLADILAVAGEDLDAIARWVRVALADCEEIFRAQETNRLFRDDGDPYRVSRGVTPAGGVMKRKTDDATSARPQRVARLSAPRRVLLPAPFRNLQRILVDDSPDGGGRDHNGDDGSERVRAVRERRRRREIQVTVVLHQDDLGEITRCGYEDAATTDCRRRGEAVVIAVSTVAG
jgi:hypothetical protein